MVRRAIYIPPMRQKTASLLILLAAGSLSPLPALAGDLGEGWNGYIHYSLHVGDTYNRSITKERYQSKNGVNTRYDWKYTDVNWDVDAARHIVIDVRDGKYTVSINGKATWSAIDDYFSSRKGKPAECSGRMALLDARWWMQDPSAQLSINSGGDGPYSIVASGKTVAQATYDTDKKNPGFCSEWQPDIKMKKSVEDDWAIDIEAEGPDPSRLAGKKEFPLTMTASNDFGAASWFFKVKHAFKPQLVDELEGANDVHIFVWGDAEWKLTRKPRKGRWVGSVEYIMTDTSRADETTGQPGPDQSSERVIMEYNNNYTTKITRSENDTPPQGHLSVHSDLHTWIIGKGAGTNPCNFNIEEVTISSADQTDDASLAISDPDRTQTKAHISIQVAGTQGTSRYNEKTSRSGSCSGNTNRSDTAIFLVNGVSESFDVPVDPEDSYRLHGTQENELLGTKFKWDLKFKEYEDKGGDES